MSYATLQSLNDQFGEEAVRGASDRDEDGVADTGVIERALALADGIIDSRIGVKYKLPLDLVPDVLISYAGDIAFYLLSGSPAQLTDEKRVRYTDALKWLDQIASGKAVLDGVAAPKTKTAVGIRMIAGEREFTRSNMRGIL